MIPDKFQITMKYLLWRASIMLFDYSKRTSVIIMICAYITCIKKNFQLSQNYDTCPFHFIQVNLITFLTFPMNF